MGKILQRAWEKFCVENNNKGSNIVFEQIRIFSIIVWNEANLSYQSQNMNNQAVEIESIKPYIWPWGQTFIICNLIF